MKNKLQVTPITEKKDYFCSENSLATLLRYYNYCTTPSKLHDMGCVDFKTIGICIIPIFIRQSGSINQIINSINNNDLVIVSIIPDNNLNILEQQGLDAARHSIIIYGYSNSSFYTIDDGKRKEVDIEYFKKIWKRTNNDVWIRKKILP